MLNYNCYVYSFVSIEAYCYYDINIIIIIFKRSVFKMPAQRPTYDKPFGAENYDNGALDDKQQEKLNQRKVNKLFL